MFKLVIVIREYSLNDCAPWHIAQDIPRRVLYDDRFEIRVNDKRFTLMIHCGSNREFHVGAVLPYNAHTRQESMMPARLLGVFVPTLESAHGPQE